jgi:low temperature requirement protein LtrA
LGYAAGAALWLVSLAFATPWRYVFWIVAQILELSLPPLSTRLHRRIPTDPRHLPERWAVFTLIVLGESVVAVAIQTSNTNWHVGSVSAAIFGFVAVACVWWLYYDRQGSVELRGSTISVVVYSYAHIPLLIGLAAMSAGMRLLIEHAGRAHLGFGAAAALLGGVVVFLLSLIGTRTVVIRGGHLRGISLKLVTCAVLLVLLALQVVLPPTAVAVLLAGTLVAAVFLERKVLYSS